MDRLKASYEEAVKTVRSRKRIFLLFLFIYCLLKLEIRKAFMQPITAYVPVRAGTKESLF